MWTQLTRSRKVYRVAFYVMYYTYLLVSDPLDLVHMYKFLQKYLLGSKSKSVDLVCAYKFLQKYLLDPKDLLLDDALVYLCRNLVCNKVPNLIWNLTESSLKEKIRDQSVSTYVLDSLSVLTLATGI